MSFFQKVVTLKPRSRGSHDVTKEILESIPELKNFSVGIAHFFL